MSSLAGVSEIVLAESGARQSISWWSKVFRQVRRWQSRVRAGRQIRQLDDRQLRDIGMTRLQAEQYAMQPFRPLIRCSHQDVLLARRWK